MYLSSHTSFYDQSTATNKKMRLSRNMFPYNSGRHTRKTRFNKGMADYEITLSEFPVIIF